MLFHLVLGLILLLPASASAEKRVALVVGNSAYLHTPKLANPKNDAADMAAALKKHGFAVIEGIGLNKAAFDRKVRDFATLLRGAGVGVFFYAGHGLQVSGRNYLVPVDAELTGIDGLEFEMVRLDVVQRLMEQLANTNIIFLDACRDNPLARNLARAMGTRSTDIGKGLAPVESGVGTLISFSTQPGNVALDGRGRNSPFTKALVQQLGSATEDLSAMLIAVRNDVMLETARKQVPWEHSSLTGRFFFDPSVVQNGPSAFQDYVRQWSVLLQPVPGESDAGRITRMKQLVALAQKRQEPGLIRDHWSIGVWEGDIKGAKFNDGSKRTLNIANVKEDGSVFGGWSATVHRAFGLGAQIRVDGDRIQVKTQSLSNVTLHRSGSDTLVGKFVLKTGASYSITLSRK